MNDVRRSWYEFAFDKAFQTKNGSAFQEFFWDIMEMCHPGDFQRVKPWGQDGDMKNDGYLKSERILFQVYAPEKMVQEKAISKIETDFNGALPHWKDYFDQWVFTHNARYGLGARIHRRLLELENDNLGLKCTTWGYSELRNKLFNLRDIEIASILGPSLSLQDMLDTGYPELKIILDVISAKEPMENQDLRPVSNEKISSNALSPSVKELINFGRIKAPYVDRFFREYHDPEYGDKIAKAFKDKYIELRNQ